MNEKIDIREIPVEQLAFIIRDVQTALDGLWRGEIELIADTGLNEADAVRVLNSINKFLSIDTRLK